MTNPNKTDNNKQTQGGQEASQGKQGEASESSTQKMGQAGQASKGQEQRGQGGSQMGGKNPPAGGPDSFRPEQPVEGERRSGGQGGQARDPYPPTNPNRPVMGTQGQNVQGQKGGGQPGGSTPGTVPGGAGANAAQGPRGAATPGLEEEEEE